MNQTACSILFCVLSYQRDLVGLPLEQTKCAPCTLPKIRTPVLLRSSAVKFHIMKLKEYSIVLLKLSVVQRSAVKLSAVQCSEVQCTVVNFSAVQ